MDTLKTLHIFLEKNFKLRAEQGNHNLMNRIVNAMESAGFSVEYHLNDRENREMSHEFLGYSLFHMQDPFHERSLNLRRAYFYPFWRIEITSKRWDFSVAKMSYPEEELDPIEAENFANSMRKRHFKDVNPSRDGFIYVPLQGKISRHRSFQTCSPIEMIERTLSADSRRRVLAGFHPNEEYTAAERNQLAALEQKCSRFELSDIGSETLLPLCDYVVTQNSSVALKGYFLRKPAVLFGQIDFHHIAGNVGKVGQEEAFHYAQHAEIDFDPYLLWFFRKTAINGGNENAEDRILDAMRKGGWRL